jgi:tRNA (adenine57-N1/adenine58-N1)-methyltransferase catalytic subunit
VSRPFVEGEKVVLVDSKKRRYLITLTSGKEFHSHAGFFTHDALIGSEEGLSVRSSGGARYVAIRPTLAEYVLKMPRGAQVIYPKDLGTILILADIFPGCRVLESGVGSGALSMTLLRAGAKVTGYELREDFAAKAIENVGGFIGESALENYDVHVRNCYDGIDGTGFDRIVLDLPEPWEVVRHATTALRPGGIILSYLPTINQTSHFRATLSAHGFAMAETIEVLHRGWHIEGASVRPDHRMVAHTGFLTHARMLGGAADETVESAIWGRGRFESDVEADTAEPVSVDTTDEEVD